MMITRKILAVSVLVIFMVSASILFPEERRAVCSMKELSNPDSPSYVPVPYPQSRENIITDLKFGLNRLYSSDRDVQLIYKAEKKGAFAGLIEDEPGIIIERIVRVKNRVSALPGDYTFLINLTDKKGDSIGRIAMEASGLILSTAKPANSSGKFKPFRDEKKVRVNLEKISGLFIGKSDIQNMDRISFQSSIGNALFPAWEIVLKDGSIYYADYFENVYKLKKQEDVYNKRINLSDLRRNNTDANIKIIRNSVQSKLLYLEKLNKK
jgi:hypothetical protein